MTSPTPAALTQEVREAKSVMMSAHALCPTELSHPDRMAWMADYFISHTQRVAPIGDERILYIFSHMGPRTKDGEARRIPDAQAIRFARALFAEAVHPSPAPKDGVKEAPDA